MLYETDYLPAIVVGGNDVWGSNDDGINVGADCLIYKYFQLQLSLQQGKYVSGGLSLCLPLLAL